MSSIDTVEYASNLFTPVWHNTVWIKDALDLYDGISGKHVKDLNRMNYGFFFGLVQRFTIESAVLGICRIYDKSNKDYKKHTIYEMVSHLEANKQYVPDLYKDNISFALLGFTENETSAFPFKLESSFVQDSFIGEVLKRMPTIETDPSLKRLVLNRNKALAHQEQVEDDLRELLKSFPSLEEMARLNDWAYGFCEFYVNCLIPNLSIVRRAASSRMAALNLIKKLLGKDFNDPSKSAMQNYSEREDFYASIE